MVPFTDMSVATGCIPTSAAMASMPAPTITVAPVADENTDPSSTTNSARSPLQKSTRPAALKSRASPVRQRFLRETKMSLITSSPRTPTRGHKTARARETPSSAKLEIGRDSFYFSMDLPSSKVTPKKATTPKKQSPTRVACSTPTSAAKPDLKTRIPTKQTPSPRKNRNSIHQSPSKVLSPTPTKTGRLDASNNGRPCSPVKRAIELDSPAKPASLNLESAGKLVPRPVFAPETHLGCVADIVEDDYDADAIPSTRPIPNPREFLPPVRKRRPTVKPKPEDIGQLMAKLKTENTMSTAHEWVSSCTVEVKISPTPLHKVSEKLQVKEPLSYMRLPSNIAPSALNVAARIESESTVIFSRPREIQQGGYEDDDIASQNDFESFLDLYTIQKAETLQHAPLHDTDSASKNRQGETRVDSGKQVECQNPNGASLEATQGLPLELDGAVETTPIRVSKSQGDIHDVQKTERRSLKAVSPVFSKATNSTGPPAVSDSHSMTGPQKYRSPCGIGSLRKPKSFNYDSESLPRVMTGSPNRPTLSRMPRAPVMPRRLPGKSIPASTQETSRRTTEKPGVGIAVPNKTKGPRTSQSASTTPSVKTARLSAPASSTPNKTTSTPNKQAFPNAKRTSSRPKIQIPLVNHTNSKGPVVPAPKHLPSKPSSKPIASPSQHESNLSSPRSILKPTSSSRKLPLQPTCSETFDAASAPRHQPSLPRPTTALPKRNSLVPVIKSWTKTPVKPPTVVLESTTPEGSPPNPPATTTPPITLAASPLSPPLNPSLVPRTLAVPPTQRPRPRHAPRYLSPNPSFPVVKRSRASTSPSPSPSPSLSPSLEIPTDHADPNASRTPSKTIIHSLDRAIDAKIAEDARRGLMLLEERERERARGQGDADGLF